MARAEMGHAPQAPSLQAGLMRVIAGQYRRRTLHSLPGREIRPTADRLRETLFNVLCAGDPAALAESTWLDLYAGTGAVGIEALSRGARMVHFVESSKAAARLIAGNLKLLGDRSMVIAEHQKKFDPGDTFGELRRYRKLVQGDAALSFYRRQ